MNRTKNKKLLFFVTVLFFSFAYAKGFKKKEMPREHLKVQNSRKFWNVSRDVSGGFGFFWLGANVAKLLAKQAPNPFTFSVFLLSLSFSFFSHSKTLESEPEKKVAQLAVKKKRGLDHPFCFE